MVLDLVGMFGLQAVWKLHEWYVENDKMQENPFFRCFQLIIRVKYFQIFVSFRLFPLVVCSHH